MTALGKWCCVSLPFSCVALIASLSMSRMICSCTYNQLPGVVQWPRRLRMFSWGSMFFISSSSAISSSVSTLVALSVHTYSYSYSYSHSYRYRHYTRLHP